MSHVLPSSLVGAFHRSGRWLGNLVDSGRLNPMKMPKVDIPPQPGVPQVDEAAQNLQQLDRIRARKGVLANLYGGASGGAAPATGQKQLLGS